MKFLPFLLLLLLSSASLAQTPVILDDVIMDEFNLALRNGRLQFGSVRAMHLPASAAGKKSFTVTFKKGSQRLASFSGEPLAPNRNVSWVTNYFRADDDASQDFLFTEPGDYKMEFSVEGKVFDEFPFSVALHKNDDGSVWYVAEGVWDELGFITNKPRIDFKFSYWMRDFLEGTGKRGHDYGKYNAKIIRAADNAVVGLSNPDQRETKPPLHMWKKFDIFFVENTERRDRLKAEKLLAKDGDYTIEFYFEGELHGRYPFSVRNGAFDGIKEYKGQVIGTDGTVFFCPRL